jgi:hypothetical protein
MKTPESPNTPLWLYVLREADAPANGKERGARLGPVGSTILMEVILGLISADPESYVHQQPQWKPALVNGDNKFELYDLLRLCDPRSMPQSVGPRRTRSQPTVRRGTVKSRRR